MNKLHDGLTAIEHGVMLLSVVLYVRATAKKSTTPGIMQKVHLETCRLGSLAVMQIAADNHLLNHVVRFIHL